MFQTPRWILGEGYPLPTPKAQDETREVWARAFDIHQIVHQYDKQGFAINGPWSRGIIDPTGESKDCNRYCDCYLRAWLELKLGLQISEVKELLPMPDFDSGEERVV